ncbi:hypothetical protein [Nocardia asiatica]|uniref:hypothetical protein n=1 Tax=Nocardia asiatica TaxID=209252 RepID=UPI0024544D21|nr:hypothetical protein [Nocardia asiatica]
MTEPIEYRQITATVPWMTEVGAKRLARQRGQSLDDYLAGLVEAELEDEAHRIREQLAEEERDIRALIEESSLGTPAARALRETVPVEVAQEVVRRANEKAMGSAADFEFVDELPPRLYRNRDDVMDQFAAALRERVGVWAKWPQEAFALNASYSTSIRKGLLKPFRGGGFEAVIRNGVLYARYTGEGQR